MQSDLTLLRNELIDMVFKVVVERTKKILRSYDSIYRYDEEAGRNLVIADC